MFRLRPGKYWRMKARPNRVSSEKLDEKVRRMVLSVFLSDIDGLSVGIRRNRAENRSGAKYNSAEHRERHRDGFVDEQHEGDGEPQAGR